MKRKGSPIGKRRGQTEGPSILDREEADREAYARHPEDLRKGAFWVEVAPWPDELTLSVARAKAEFADCVRKAEAGTTVVIRGRGRAVAALVPVDRLRQMERLRSAGPESGLAGLAGGWPGSAALVDTLTRSRRSKPRRVPKFGR